jgi:hypothetical protein
VPNGVQQAGGADAKKAGAMKLLAEGRTLADQGNFAAAKTKYTEADKLGAAFAPGEYNPGFALQELNTRGAAKMDQLVRDAQASSARKDFAQADAQLTGAAQIAATLGLFPKPVAEAKATLYVASSGKYGTASPSGIAPLPGPEYLVGANPVGGNTPTVPLSFASEGVTLWVKCEFLNPSGSIKDRLAKHVLTDADRLQRRQADRAGGRNRHRAPTARPGRDRVQGR